VTHAIREMLDRQTVKWGATVMDFTLEDVRLLTTTRRDMGAEPEPRRSYARRLAPQRETPS
jgi:hypothetical protein